MTVIYITFKNERSCYNESMKSKGTLTKETILKSAFDFASQFGFEALSIGKLADSVGLSKSGLFGHFKSKEKLQCMVLDYAAQNYTRKVITPVLTHPRGLPRVRALTKQWILWVSDDGVGGCPLLAAAIEFDDRPGPVLDRVRFWYQKKIDFVVGAIALAISEGHLSSDTNAKDMAHELYSLMIGHHLFSRLLKEEDAIARFERSVEDLIARHLAPKA